MAKLLIRVCGREQPSICLPVCGQVHGRVIDQGVWPRLTLSAVGMMWLHPVANGMSAMTSGMSRYDAALASRMMTETNYRPSPWKPIADHVDRYLATDGADGFSWEGAECIILTTVGRKTGSLRRSPLIRIRDGSRYIAIGSMGGAPQHPNWYFNLMANPEVIIQDRAEIHHLIARTATPEERAELWPLAVQQWPDYDNYQARTERVIPVVICEPPTAECPSAESSFAESSPVKSPFAECPSAESSFAESSPVKSPFAE